MLHRHWSIEQAQRVLPQVKLKMAELMKLESSLLILESIDIEYDDVFEQLGHEAKLGKELARIQLESCTLLADLYDMGIFVKDVQEGLVDFFTTHEGREIVFCWKAGEEDIQHWHEVDAGFGGRRPLDELRIRHQR